MRLIRRSRRWVYALSLVSILSALTPAPGNAQSLLASGEFDLAGDAGSLYIGDQHNPEAIAFGDGFLVLWDDRLGGREDIFARRMGAGGEWLGAGRIRISTAGGIQKRPAVVEVGGRALAVWEDGRNGLEAGSRDLYATFVEPDGSVADPRGFLFIPTVSDKSDIELATNGDTVVAVWEDRPIPQGIPTIMAMRFGADGAAIDADPAPVGRGVEPVVAAGANGFMLVYQALPDDRQTLLVQRISADLGEGVLVGESSVLYGKHCDEPTIAWDGEQFAAAWIREAPGSTESFEFSRISVEGALIDSPPLVLGPIDENSEVDLVADGRGYLVVHDNRSVCIATPVTVGEGGELESGAPITLSRPRNFAQDPSAAIARDGEVLITWEDELWEVGGNSSGFGENLFSMVGDLLGNFTEPRVMASALGEFPDPREAGVALVQDGDGVGVLWRTASSADTAGSVFYTRTSAASDWQAEPQLLGSDSGSGVWAVEAGGRMLCYWASDYWLRMMDAAQIGTGAAARVIYPPLSPVSQTEIASDGEDVFVFSTVLDQSGVLQPVLSVLDGGETVVASSVVAASCFELGGIVASGGKVFCAYWDGSWLGRRARLLPGNVLEIEPDEIAIPQGEPAAFPGQLRQCAMVAGPDGVELVWAYNTRLQHLWIPWGFGEQVVATELDLRGNAPSLHRDGGTTTLVTTGLLPYPPQQLVTWTDHDPSAHSTVQRIDLAPATSRTPAIQDAAGRLIFVSGDGEGAYLSGVDPPVVAGIGLPSDGLARVDLNGLAFGVFDLESSLDLRTWMPTGLPAVPIGGDGRASFTGVDAGAARFWRGVYRPR